MEILKIIELQNNKPKDSKGITLIALVIAVIVLIILTRSSNYCIWRNRWITK